MLSRHQTRALHALPTAAERIGKAMDFAKVKQEALEAQCGVPQSTISKLLTGDRKDVTVRTAQRLAKAFGCRIEDLFPEHQVAA